MPPDQEQDLCPGPKLGEGRRAASAQLSDHRGLWVKGRRALERAWSIRHQAGWTPTVYNHYKTTSSLSWPTVQERKGVGVILKSSLCPLERNTDSFAEDVRWRESLHGGARPGAQMNRDGRAQRHPLDGGSSPSFHLPSVSLEFFHNESISEERLEKQSTNSNAQTLSNPDWHARDRKRETIHELSVSSPGEAPLILTRKTLKNLESQRLQLDPGEKGSPHPSRAGEVGVQGVTAAGAEPAKGARTGPGPGRRAAGGTGE